MKIKHIYLVLSLVSLSFLAVTAFSSGIIKTGGTNKDIIKFSHKKHESLDCQQCHKEVESSTSLKASLLPKKEACAECHDVEDDKNCTLCHYEEKFEALVKKESSVYFNHKFHIVDKEQKECTACHKGIQTVDYAFETPVPGMNSCYTCHNNKAGGAEYCESCHILTINLLPSSHKAASFKKTHKILAKGTNSNCQMCHDDASCEACHVATKAITESNSKKDFFAPYSTYNLVDGTKQQTVTKVHDLNYKFTHGIDFKGKTSECKTCHNTETFCVECHDTKGGDFPNSGTTPANHFKPNFVTIGAGSGGGEHAVFAKRDIERCASCHDVNGGDANCIMCHADNDGVKGTNPKTHARNYMKSRKGDWHTDQGSVCYNCHIDANARPKGVAGIGFCGYCHSSK